MLGISATDPCGPLSRAIQMPAVKGRKTEEKSGSQGERLPHSRTRLTKFEHPG
jgi:hypothetical protein